MSEFPVTLHTIIKNEDQFIYYSLMSVLPFVSKALIIDTGSTDKTWKIINNLKKEFENKIECKQIKIKSAKEISNLRQNLIKETKTPFFMLLDGDEIWIKKELIKLLKLTKTLPKSKIAVVNKTRNCVGDIYHFLPESFGKYKLLGKVDHLNIRLMRNLNYSVKGIYPDEGYYLDNKLINNLDGKLQFSDSWYLHATHLGRSSNLEKPFGRRKKTIYTKGLKIKKSDLSQIFFQEANTNIFKKRSMVFEIKAFIFDFLRKLK